MDSKSDSKSGGNSVDGGIYFRDDDENEQTFGFGLENDSHADDRDTGPLSMQHKDDSDFGGSQYDDTVGELGGEREHEPIEPADLNDTTINSVQNNVDTAEFDQFRDEYIEHELALMEEEEEKVDSDAEGPEHKEGERAPVGKSKPSPATPQIVDKQQAQLAPSGGSNNLKGRQTESVISEPKAPLKIDSNAPVAAAGDVKSGGTAAQAVSSTAPVTTAGGTAAKEATGTAQKPSAEAPTKPTASKAVEPSSTQPASAVDAAEGVKAGAPTASEAPATGKGPTKPTDKPIDKPAGKPADKSTEKSADKPADKSADTVSDKLAGTQRGPSAAAPLKTSPRPTTATQGEVTAASQAPGPKAATAGTSEPALAMKTDGKKTEPPASKTPGSTSTSKQPTEQPSSCVTQEELDEVRRDMETLHKAAAKNTAAPTTAGSNSTVGPSDNSPALSARGDKAKTAAPIAGTASVAKADAKGVDEAKRERPVSDMPVSRFKKNREAAESAGNKGGDMIPSAMPQADLALKLQATWRGKQERRALKLKQISASTIQRVFRGLYVRHRSSAQLNNHREKIAAEQTRKTRLAHIRSKEKDLALLSTIPSEQYMGFERLRRENGAKTIQRNWRSMQMERQFARMAASEAELDNWLGDDMLLGSKAAACFDTRRFPHGFQSKPGKPSGTTTRIAGTSTSLLTSKVASEEQVLREQSAKLKDLMVNAIQGAISDHKRDELFAKYKAQSETPRTASAKPTPGTAGTTANNVGAATPGAADSAAWKKYEIEIEALALAQLQRRIRESAHNRTRKQDLRANKSGFRASSAFAGRGVGDRATDVSSSFDATRKAEGTGNGTGGAPRWGARRNYQDLMEAQMHANILLQEHQYALPHIMQRQEARHKTLGNCQHLLEQLQKPLSLEQAKAFIGAKQSATAQAAAPLPVKDNKGAEAKTTATALDPQAEAWLVDEELWNTGKYAGNASVGGTNAGAAVRLGHALYVEAGAIQAATEQHVQALYALRTSSITHDNPKQHTTFERTPSGRAKHWGAVALPLPLHVVTAPATAAPEVPSSSIRSSGEWKDLRGSFNRSFDGESGAPADKSAAKAAAGLTPGSLSQRLLTDAKLFRPLASQWAKGSDVEDSLYWIAYATQPSNIVPGKITPSPLQAAEPAITTKTGAESAAPTVSDAQTARENAHKENKDRTDKENEELRRRIAVEAMALSQRVPRVVKQCKHEEERIARLAEVYQAEMFAYLRREHALSAQQLLGGERAQQQHRAACRIQAAARGRSARAYTSGIRAQRRVYVALQNLLNEISHSEGVSAPALPVPSHGNTSRGRQSQASGRAAVLGTLLSALPGAGSLPPPRQYTSKGAVGSGHSAASLSRASSSTLAGLNITSSTAGQSSNVHSRMGGTQMSGLTTTPHHGTCGHSNSANMSALSATLPSTGGRVGYAEGLLPQYPLQAVAPPTNRQYSATHTDTKNLVSNVNAIHVHAHNNTPSYFSPMVSGQDNMPPSTRGIGAHYEDYSARGDYSSDMVGIAGAATPGASVVNRGAWHGATPGKRSSSYGNDAGPGTAPTLGISSPSKQTFKLLNANFTAADQVPSESLNLSSSYTSEQHDGTTAPRSPSSRGGAFKRSAYSAQGESKHGGSGAYSPKHGVSFSLELELPESADQAFPTGNQLRRSEDFPGETPQRGNAHTPGSPGSHASHALSEFSFMHDEDVNPGAAYISSPGHSQSGNSLSRSLSASFGQVSDKFTQDHTEGKYEDKPASPVAMSPGGRKNSRYPDDYASATVSSARTGAGALNPAMLAHYGKQHSKPVNPLDVDSDDSVEGLELSYNGGDGAAGGSVKGFRIHGSAQAAQRAERAAVVVGQAMSAVEQRFRSDTCSVKGFIASALAADVKNFDKSAALRLLQSMAMVTGVVPLVKWLQRFRYDPQQAQLNDPDYVPPAAGAGKPSPSTSLVLEVGEIQVQDCALLIAELSAELRIMDTSAPAAATGTSGSQKTAPKSEQEREKEMLFNLIQSCVLMKLLGAATDSGRLKISEIQALLEDAWIRAVPNNGARVSLMFAQLRFSLLQQATRKAGHPRKLFDDIVAASKVTVVARTSKSSSLTEQWQEEDCLSSASVCAVFQQIFATSASFSAYSANKALCLELAQALVRFNAWSDTEDYVPVSDLRNTVCNLCSFRILQKRLQVWFRAVPGMHQTLLQHIGAQLNADSTSNGMVSVAAFCRCADLSSVPLSQSECFMLAQLLTRRRTPATGSNTAASAESGPTGSYVDIALLQRIKAGDFLHAALV